MEQATLTEPARLIVEPDFTRDGGWRLTFSKPLVNADKWAARRARKLSACEVQEMARGVHFAYDGGLILRTFLNEGCRIEVLVDPDAPNMLLIEPTEEEIDSISLEISFRCCISMISDAFKFERLLEVEVRYIEL